MPLAELPQDASSLQGFPTVQLRGEPLHRIFRHRDPRTGERRGTFYFASVSDAADGGGRFDLPEPHGACYLARTPVGAWLEKFRAMVVDRTDVRAHRILTTRAPYSLRAADLLDRAARGFGVTGEIHTADANLLTRRWAHRFHQAGFRAIHGKVRHDPVLEQRSVTLFDEAGEHEPFGWQWREEIGRLDTDKALVEDLVRYGYRIAEAPYDVTLSDPHEGAT